VLGILLSGTYGWFSASQDFVIGNTTIIPEGGISPVWLSVAIGAILLVFFFRHIGSDERAGKEPLLSPRLFKNRIANLGLITQNVQWTIMQGTFFVTSVFLQTVWGNNAIQTGLLITPATIGILAASAVAGRMAQRRSQRTLVRAGFVGAIVGLLLILLLVSATSGNLSLVPGLLIFGAGVGIMLTASVNVVQSSFPDSDQGEISGLSRCVSNLGSSFGTAFVGSLMVVPIFEEAQAYRVSVIALIVITAIGLVASLLVTPIRRARAETTSSADHPVAA
jgi:MFS family permease